MVRLIIFYKKNDLSYQNNSDHLSSHLTNIKCAISLGFLCHPLKKNKALELDPCQYNEAEFFQVQTGFFF